MIRTNSVKLTTLPNAIAYRRKAQAGGSAIVIIRADEPQPGIATISKTSGEPIIAVNTPSAYPVEAFAEAMELTAGLPYRKQGKPAAPEIAIDVVEEVEDDEQVEVIIDSAEYQSIVDAYTDKKGKLSYDLLNKDLIQLAHKSDVVARMVAAGDSEDAILTYVIGARFRNTTGNNDLTDDQVAAMAALIDEVSPKGAFKELKAKVRSMLSEAKRQ